METIRGRLTAGYAAALAVTLLVFAGALYGTRRRATYRAMLANPPRDDAHYHHLTHPRQADALVQKLSNMQRTDI